MNIKEAIRPYVRTKQLMGKSFHFGAQTLQAFCKHTGNVPITRVTKSDVVAFLDRSQLSDLTWVMKYRVLDAFFQYWAARGVRAKSPMPSPRRPVGRNDSLPHLYTAAEVRRLLNEVDSLHSRTVRQSSPATFRALFLFLYGTGARITEAFSLKCEDVDLERATVTLGTYSNRRTIPIGIHLRHELREYVSRLNYGGDRIRFFVRKDGKAIQPTSVARAFQLLRRRARIPFDAKSSRPPYVQDFRRTFAVTCARSWIKQKKDLRDMVPILSAYLGHVSITSTEAYLAFTPERFLTHLQSLEVLQR